MRMNIKSIAAGGWAVLAGVLLVAANHTGMDGVASAQSAPQGAAVKRDAYQRSTMIYSYTTTAASGASRGEELYYYKCWMCHNQFAKAGPQLKDLFKRAAMTSGEPVNDQSVADKIRKGGPAMPAFGHELKDADIADLLSYIKDGCCFDAEEPPPNPRYRGGR